jgi:preprotein translocase subunit SecD
MKTINFLIIGFLVALLSTISKESSNAQEVNFGIYETIKVKEIPITTMHQLKLADFHPENDNELPIIGYILKNATVDSPYENTRLLKTAYTVDKEGKYYAVVAVKNNPVITNSEIQRTKSIGKNVEIYFNINGARKWAELTKRIQGRMVAFVIDDMIYALPTVNSEIRNGIAIISNLENETKAREIAESLN